VILVQAGGYWLLARGWVQRGPMPSGPAKLYRAFRLIDAVLLAAGLAGVLAWANGDAVLALAVWSFGVLEFVNYFVVRLAYPPGRWLRTVGQRRTPRLVADMEGQRRRARAVRAA
jgi:hypothetical protein